MPLSLRLRSLGRALTAGGVVALVAACSSIGPSEPPPACPTVRLDRDTAAATQFTGGGQDITDTAFRVELLGYGGDCEYDDEDVTVTLVPQFGIERGPAAPAGAARGSFEYFVAIPSFYPSPAGKQVFPLGFTFPDPVTPRIIIRDEPVTITIPRAPGESLADEEIFLGLQLSPAQLDFNRRSRAAR